MFHCLKYLLLVQKVNERNRERIGVAIMFLDSHNEGDGFSITPCHSFALNNCCPFTTCFFLCLFCHPFTRTIKVIYSMFSPTSSSLVYFKFSKMYFLFLSLIFQLSSSYDIYYSLEKFLRFSSLTIAILFPEFVGKIVSLSFQFSFIICEGTVHHSMPYKRLYIK